MIPEPGPHELDWRSSCRLEPQTQFITHTYDFGSGEYSLEDDMEDAGGGVLIYIDNSNIWINTMEYSAKALQFINDIKQDHRIRVNINKLLSTASENRPIIRAVLYGSEPPPVEKFWNNVKECGFCKVDVQVTNRSTYSNKEREVDQNIMLDIGEDIVIHQNHAKHGGTVILFTGDGGMIASVRRAVKYNWNVEVWSYRSSLAKVYDEESKINDKVTLKYMDDCFSELIFYKLVWKTYLPEERSFVMTFTRVPNEKKPEILELMVKAITQLVRMPMAGRYIKEKDEKTSKETHLALVCSVGQQILKEDSRTTNKLDDHNHYQNGRKNSSHFQLTSEQMRKISELFQWPYGAVDNQMKQDLESIFQDTMKTNNGVWDHSPKYDFNTDVYHKVDASLDNVMEHDTESSEECPLYTVIRKYKPVIRSVPQFLQDMKWDTIQEFEMIKLESPALEDDGEGGFTVYTNRKQGRKFQKYSAPCKYSFRCHNGFKCTYKHTDMEKEFFKIQSNPKLRYCYKSIPCDHYPNQKCRYRASMSYMCPYAHGAFCLTCKCDEDGGHNFSTCPAGEQPTP